MLAQDPLTLDYTVLIDAGQDDSFPVPSSFLRPLPQLFFDLSHDLIIKFLAPQTFDPPRWLSLGLFYFGLGVVFDNILRSKVIDGMIKTDAPRKFLLLSLLLVLFQAKGKDIVLVEFGLDKSGSNLDLCIFFDGVKVFLLLLREVIALDHGHKLIMPPFPKCRIVLGLHFRVIVINILFDGWTWILLLLRLLTIIPVFDFAAGISTCTFGILCLC